jgi:hypothetical protein
MGEDSNREIRYKAAANEVLAGLSDRDAAEGLTHLKVLVDSWYDDAGTIDPESLFRIGMSDVKEALGTASGAKVVQKLAALALERAVETLSSRAFRLAQGVIDETTSAQSVQGDAKVIAQEIESLLPRVRQLSDAALKERLLRELSDADLECRYIKDGDASMMSIRLNQYSDR